MRADAIEVYKFIHELYDPKVALDIGINIRVTYQLRGHKYRLGKARTKTAVRKSFFYEQGCEYVE